MRTPKIAVIGDAMIDLRRWGPSSRTSPEDPNCRVIDIVGEQWELGGAANVARWLALGQQQYEVHLICQFGFDRTGRWLQQLCAEAGVWLDTRWLRRSGDYHTTLKERLCVIDPELARIRQFVRCDRDTNMKLSAHERDGLIQHMVEDDPFDFYVIADYGKGVFNSPYSPKLLNWLGHFSCRRLVVVNSKSPDRWADVGTTALICNEEEIRALKTQVGRTDNDLHAAGETDYLVVTMSDRGVRLIHHPEGEFEIIRAETKAGTVLDVTGAGDAFTAGFAYEMFRQSGTQPHMGARTWLDKGSEWAAQCCGQIGCGRPLTGGDKEVNNGPKVVSYGGMGTG
jgi:rfaE bifunctional protein kinase chain/domain